MLFRRLFGQARERRRPKSTTATTATTATTTRHKRTRDTKLSPPRRQSSKTVRYRSRQQPSQTRKTTRGILPRSTVLGIPISLCISAAIAQYTTSLSPGPTRLHTLAVCFIIYAALLAPTAEPLPAVCLIRILIINALLLSCLHVSCSYIWFYTSFASGQKSQYQPFLRRCLWLPLTQGLSFGLGHWQMLLWTVAPKRHLLYSFQPMLRGTDA